MEEQGMKKKSGFPVGRAILCGVLALFIIAANVAVNFFAGYFDKMYTVYEAEASEVNHVSYEEAMAHGQQVTADILREGSVLLKNENNTLPLANTTKVNLFGWRSTKMVFGGAGSGFVDDTTALSLEDALKEQGIEANPALLKLYTDYSTAALIIVAVAIAVKLILGRFVKKTGEKVDSDSLIASGADATMDAAISTTTLVAAIIYLTTHVSLEAWLGAIISIVIIKSGYEMLQEVRKEYKLPVLMMSAKTDDASKILGLEVGADDFIDKPFSFPVLSSKIKALIRRSYDMTGSKEIVTYKDISINTKERIVTKGGKPVNITGKEYDILLYFMEHPEEVIKKEKLFNEVWGVDCFSEMSTMNVYIRWLREKLEEDPKNPQYIRY